jgi:hypothetical protein
MSKATSESCPSCPRDTSAPVQPKRVKRKIVLELEDDLSTNSNTTIIIKKIKKFLDYDLKQYQITGHVDSYTNSKTDIKGSHHTLSFFIQEKKSKNVSKLVIDFLINQDSSKDCEYNCKKAPGVVSVSARGFIGPTIAKDNKKTIEPGTLPSPGDQATIGVNGGTLKVVFDRQP